MYALRDDIVKLVSSISAESAARIKLRASNFLSPPRVFSAREIRALRASR